MRRVHRVAVVLGSVGLVVLAHAGGCIINEPIDCQTALVDCATTGSSSSSGTGSTGGSQPEGCDPSKTSKAVADSCGVFVSPNGDDGNAGTKEKPVKTIMAALKKGATIYACAGATPFSEAVTLGKAATLYGAVDCVSWIHDATKKTQLTTAAAEVPLTAASAAGGSEIRDFAITAADAKLAGGSSIAVFDDHADLTLERVDVVAGAGAAGAPGMP